jgi:hypothetical protein
MLPFRVNALILAALALGAVASPITEPVTEVYKPIKPPKCPPGIPCTKDEECIMIGIDAYCVPKVATPCGNVMCTPGTSCCNACCSMCAPPGMMCTQQCCVDGKR